MPDHLIHHARKMRQNPSEAEKTLWRHLKSKQLLGLKFRRQVPIENCIVDFLCAEKRLIIELDGGQHNEESAKQYDQQRTDRLSASGFVVLRFWNNDVLGNIEGVLQTIASTVNPHPDLPPQGEGN